MDNKTKLSLFYIFLCFVFSILFKEGSLKMLFFLQAWPIEISILRFVARNDVTYCQYDLDARIILSTKDNQL